MHRVTALEDTTILEVSTPHLDDVVRLEDAYGRAGTSDPDPGTGAAPFSPADLQAFLLYRPVAQAGLTDPTGQT